MTKNKSTKNPGIKKPISQKLFGKLIRFEEDNPFKILGPHLNKTERTVQINTFLPFVKKAWIKLNGGNKKYEMDCVSREGIFQIIFTEREKIFLYKIIYQNLSDELIEIFDPYAFNIQLSDLDIHLLGEGNHLKTFDKLGARVCSVNKVNGVHFSVWAPNARSVSIVGEFNDWTHGHHPMQKINESGYWCLFMPGMRDGTMYKYTVKSKKGKVIFKSDPYAFEAELRPGNASVVSSFKKYKWTDGEWMKKRKNSTKTKPSYKTKAISIYEVHPGSWKKDFDNTDFPNEWGYKNYRQLAHELADYVKEMNYTHIELLPVMEHPLDISWGYQVVNYFAPSSRYGKPEDFQYFVDHCHKNGIGVILDWVPSHFPTDEHGLALFDGTECYAYENPLKGFHKDWGTNVFDYGKNEVTNFLISNALFWFEKYHIDGLRVDAVASMLYLDYSRNDGEWIPNIHGGNENLEAIEFLKKLNDTVHKKIKGVMMIAEESSSWPGVTRATHLGGLGFDMKWNMGWMHDILAYFSMDPIFRKFHHGKLTFSIWYAFNENFLLPISHDEVVHLKKSVIEKMPGDEWHKFANLRLMFGFMFSHPGKKLNFMGNDIAQFKEWNSETSLDWDVLDNEMNKKYHQYFKELNRLYKKYPAFHEDDFESSGFQWLDFSDADKCVIAFVRYSKDKNEMILFTFNMTPVERVDYLFGVPKSGYYKEILNSNAAEYGGTGIGNLGGVNSEHIPRFEFPDSIKVTLPPLAVNVYRYEAAESQEVKAEIEESFEELKETELIETQEKENIEDTKEVKTSQEEKKEISNDDVKMKINITDEAKSFVGDEVEKKLDTNELDDLIGSDIKMPTDGNSDEKTDTASEEIKDKKPFDLSEDEMNEKIKEIINRIKKF